MRIRLAAVVLDAAELEPESRFWHDVLGGRLARRERHHILYLDDAPILAIQLAAAHLPPQWPTGREQQIHLDFAIDDIRAARTDAWSTPAPSY